jgi:hypothetical protein
VHLELLLPAELQGSPQTQRPHPWWFPSWGSVTQGPLCLGSPPLAGLQLKNPAQACAVLLCGGPRSSWKPQQWPIWAQKCGHYTHALETAPPRPLSDHRLSVTGLLIKDVFPSPPSPPSCHSLCKEVAFFPGEPPPLIASQCPGKSAVSLTFILLNSAEAREFNPALILDSTIAKAMIQHFCF